MKTSAKHPYVVTGQDLLDRKETSIPMLLKPILQQTGIATLIGGSEVGKSFLMLDICLAICSKEDKILDLEINRTHGSVIYVSSEDDELVMSIRMKALTSQRQINAENIRVIFETDNLVGKLEEQLTNQPADLVVIDTLGDLFVGNINNGTEVRRFLKPFRAIAHTHKCVVLFLHHVNKAGYKSLIPNKNDVSGSEALQSAFRVVFSLTKSDDNTLQFSVLKGNNIPDDLKKKGTVLKFDPAKGFTTTGQSVKFKSEKNKVHGITGFDPKIAEMVSRYHKELGSQIKVADELRRQGYKIDKNKVGDYLKYLSSHPETMEK